MIIESGWDFVTLARLQWGDDMGSGNRQFAVIGDHHWFLYGTRDLAVDRFALPDAWADEVIAFADQDFVRYVAVVVEAACAEPDYSPDAYPFDTLLRERARARGVHHMGTYFLDPQIWSSTGPMKTFSTYVGAENYPRIEAHAAQSYPDPRRASVLEQSTGAD